ncbi:MAG: hypothetical protein JXX28_19885 [Deltaproteobacteria bacterium]|nr:hypothetical protein [Deltaproteobacteria bacterium]
MGAEWTRMIVSEVPLRTLVVCGQTPEDWSVLSGEGETGVWLLQSYDASDRGRFVASAAAAGVEWLSNKASLATWLALDATAPHAASAPPRPPARGESSPTSLLGRVMEHATWDEESGGRELEADRRHLVRTFPKLPEGELNRRVKIGHRIRNTLEQIEREARKRGFDSPSVNGLLDEADAIRWDPDGEINWQARTLYLRRLQRKMAWLEGHARGDRAHHRAPPSPPPAEGPLLRRSERSHRVDTLRPHRGWTLVIDETGTSFNHGGVKAEAGRWVGVLVPHGSDLPPVTGFHGTDAAPLRRAKVLQDLLDREVGVIGLTVDGVHKVEADGWQVGVMALVEWALRLLPRAPGESFPLEVYVEQRGGSAAGQRWDAAATELKRQLEVRGVEGTGGVRLSLDVVGKDGHPHLAYADAVAYQWHPSERDAGGLLAASGLREQCLIEGDALLLARAWDAGSGAGRLSAGDWAALLRRERADGEGSLAAVASRRLQVRAGQEPGLWGHYLGLVTAHLESKAADNALLSLQEDWLESVDVTYPRNRRVLLEWHLDQLRLQNHLGGVAYALARQIAEEAEAIREEDPALACEADLNRAVVGMNAFRFAQAERLVVPWTSERPIVPGLRMWCRAWSSLGQLQAFQGRLEEARGSLSRALTGFERLADPAMSLRERSHTSAYLAMVSMDDPTVSDQDAAAALLRYAQLLLPEVEGVEALAEAVARSKEHRLVYLHHAVVRFLASRGEPEARAAYLAALGPRWSALGEGHPWPLIALYRGLLLDGAGRAEDGMRLIREGVDLSMKPEMGPTVALIGATLDAVLRRHGEPVSADSSALRAGLSTSLPAAGARVALLARPGDFASDLELVRAVLPFAFR